MKQGLAMMGVDTDDDSPTKDRKTLQEIGLYFREKDPNWWVNLMVKKTKQSIQDGADVILCDDLRFKNEYAAIAGLETHAMVYLVHIDVSERTQALRGAAMDRMDHPSETDLDDYGPDMWDLWIPEESTVPQRVQWIEHLIINGTSLRST